jgi:hypothetical protein
MTNYLYDRKLKVLTVLENAEVEGQDELVQSHIAYILHRNTEMAKEKDDPFDKEKIVLPR